MFRPLNYIELQRIYHFDSDGFWLGPNATLTKRSTMLRWKEKCSECDVSMWIAWIKRSKEEASTEKTVGWNLGCNQAVIRSRYFYTEKSEHSLKTSPSHMIAALIWNERWKQKQHTYHPTDWCANCVERLKCCHWFGTLFYLQQKNVDVDEAISLHRLWPLAGRIQKSEDKVNYSHDMRASDLASQTNQIETVFGDAAPYGEKKMEQT